MNKIKQATAWILILCMMIGLPMAVSAVPSQTLALHSIIVHTNNRLKLTFSEELRTANYFLPNNGVDKLNPNVEMGLAWVKDTATGTEDFEDVIEGERVMGAVVSGATYDVLVWSPKEPAIIISDLLKETKAGCTLKFYFYDNGCHWNNNGAIGAIQDKNGAGLACPDLGKDREKYEYLFADIHYDLELTEAKFIGENQVLFAFNKPIESNKAHFVGLSLYNASGAMLAYKRNSDDPGYVFDTISNLTPSGGSFTNGDGITSYKRAQWPCSGDWKPFGENGRQFLTTIGDKTTCELIRTITESSNGVLRFRIQENTNAEGYVSKDSRVNSVWAVANGNDYLKATAAGTQDQAWVTVDEWNGEVAKIGSVTYSTLQEALGEAKDGDTVALTYDVSVGAYAVIGAGVTLDLNGRMVIADNFLAFGEVIDSTEGTGALVISRDPAISCIHLLTENPAFPLYDANIGGYRFFTYGLRNVGTKTDAENIDRVKYGIKLKFDSLRAYELLADEDNADVSLVMSLIVGSKEISYKFSRRLFEALYQAVKGDNFVNRGIYAITLTVSGLDSLSSRDALVAKPMFFSAQKVMGVDAAIPYEGDYDSYTRAKAWIEEQIEKDTLFSFNYGGVPYAEHMNEENWEKNVTETAMGWIVSYTHKVDKVVAWSEITFDREMASIEWTNYFKNNGTEDSPIIADIRAMNSTVAIEDPMLTSANGSTGVSTDFQSFSVDLTQEVYSMATTGGRSSQGAFPYFEIGNGSYGIMGGIGWTGNWSANFVNHNGNVTVDAGMQETYISLYAGEQMRTPMIMIQFYKGDQDDGHNALRQLMLKSYTPSDASGMPLEHAMLSFGVGDAAEDGEDAMLSQAKWLDQYECLWIDAGWFGTSADATWSAQVGNWYFIPNKYNDNDDDGDRDIQKLSSYLQLNGKDLLLWFEPERVRRSTQLYRNKSDFMLNKQGEYSTYLYNFSDDEACDYMINFISGIIQENGVTWYRQDFNMEPETYWSNNEPTHRVGMTEIKYITNLYRYFDALIEKNPGLMIDNCASGGRRLDLEMMKRSVPLWNSDYVTEDGSTYDGVRANNYNLSWWLPIHAGGWPWKDYNKSEQGVLDKTYAFRVDMNSGMQLGYSLQKDPDIQELIEQYFVCRELMNGDYYILASGVSESIDTADACYEFYKPMDEKGYLVAFRPKNCSTESATYYLKGLDARATYELELVDSGEKLTMTGQELMESGLQINYSQSNLSLLIYLTKQ